MKNLVLKRLLPRLPDKTLGVLMNDDGYPICLSIERAWLNNQPLISCIPLGKYPMIRKHSDRFNCDIFQILNVLNRDFVEMHRGNFYEDSEGCIILGEQFGLIENKQGVMEFGVEVSSQAFSYFMNSVMTGINEATLTIMEV